MRVFMQKCKKRDVKFCKLKYRIRATATIRDKRAKGHHGEHIVDWTAYADDLELEFENISDLLII